MQVLLHAALQPSKLHMLRLLRAMLFLKCKHATEHALAMTELRNDAMNIISGIWLENNRMLFWYAGHWEWAAAGSGGDDAGGGTGVGAAAALQHIRREPRLLRGWARRPARGRRGWHPGQCCQGERSLTRYTATPIFLLFICRSRARSWCQWNPASTVILQSTLPGKEKSRQSALPKATIL